MLNSIEDWTKSLIQVYTLRNYKKNRKQKEVKKKQNSLSLEMDKREKKINKIKSWFFEKINKMDKLLTRRKNEISNAKNKRRGIKSMIWNFINHLIAT